MSVRATVEGETVEHEIKQSNNPNNQTILEIPLRNFKAWSPEHPNLYWATIELLKDGKVVQTRRERFGVKKFEVRGKDFYLNDKPFFVRGAGWHDIDPVNGLTLPDREEIRAQMRKVRAAGFNFIRCHTHCKWPEFYEVADEQGLMIEAELPYYNDGPTMDFAFDPIGDATELWTHFRRHVSFSVYSGCNEGWFGPACSRKLAAAIRTMDPDRLVQSGDAAYRAIKFDKEYTDYTGGPIDFWPRGSVDPDCPFVCHEYLNISVKYDTRQAEQFGNALWKLPVSREARRDWLARFGLDMEIGDRLQDAQNRYQAIWLKHGLETARLDPFCDGYSYWSLQDCTVEQLKFPGTFAAQALFDPFWGDKRYGHTAQSVRVFNGPSCLLLDTMPVPHMSPASGYKSGVVENFDRVFVAGETIPARIFFAHYGDAPLAEGHLEWKLATKDGRTLAEGSEKVPAQTLGPAREIAALSVVVPPLEKGVAATLSVRLEANGQRVCENAWDLWLLEKGPSRAEILADAARRGVVVAAEGSAEARAALAAGKSLVTLAGQDGKNVSKPGWWWMDDHVGTVLADHPALKYIPHDGLVSPLIFRLMKKGRTLPLRGVGQDGLLIVSESGGECTSLLAEQVHPTGVRQLLATGLDLMTETPEGNAILRGCVEYLAAQPKPAVLTRPFLGFNEDDTHFYGGPAERVTRKGFEGYIDDVCRGRVTDFFICANAQTAIFSSKTFDPCWQNFKGEPIWYAQNLKRLEETTGKTAIRHWIEVCRERGIRPWVSMRMNDVHGADDINNPLCSNFWRTHADCWVSPVYGDPATNVCRGWSSRSLDYSKKPVYDYHLAFVRELVERFGDAEGLEIDWLRGPSCLRRGQEAELHHVLTDFMRDVRKAVDAAAAKTGHRMKVSVRVPTDPDRCMRYGFRPVDWAREGLVDMIMPSNYKVSPDYRLPYAEWCRRIAAVNPSVRIVPGVDSCLDFHGTGDYRNGFRMLTADEFRGWADTLFAEGASGFYLYNLYENPPDAQVWNDVLSHGFDRNWVADNRRRYPVTYMEDPGPRSPAHEPLPAKLADGVKLDFRIGTSAKEGDAVAVYVAFDRKAPRDFAKVLTLNGVAPTGISAAPIGAWLAGVRPNMPSVRMKDATRFAYVPENVADSVRLDFAPSAVRPGHNEIVVLPCEGSGTRLMCLELEIVPKSGSPGCGQTRFAYSRRLPVLLLCYNTQYGEGRHRHLFVLQVARDGFYVR